MLVSKISENLSNTLLVTFMSLLMVSKFILATFLHEPSGIPIYALKHENHSDFGFAMGYQSSRNELVVGAPSESVHGRVYVCNMDGANKSSEINCEEKSISIPVTSRSNQTVKFHLGASFAATSEHFLTCAPLWTVRLKNKNKFETNVVGTCFFDGNRYTGIYEQYMIDTHKGPLTFKFNTKTFVGGTGWTTLADEANDLLLVVKSSLDGDIAFGRIEKNLKMNSMLLKNKTATLLLSKFHNLGFGITAGKFFSNNTVYAFNMDTADMHGIVEFLDYNPGHLNLMNSKTNINMKSYTIQSKGIATKFGSVLAAADMNNDGFDDLLVAEPLHTEEDCVDCGALHVYLGAEMDTIGNKNYLQILGTDNFGRLGSAVAVNDLDGDGVAELSVSAPYADGGLGVVYIISGYEVKMKLQQKQELQLQLSELKHTQRVQKETFRTLGFSLQFVSDTDDNGCRELVAGAPGSGEAVLLKCVQAIDISLSSDIIGEKRVREQDLNFTVQVCAEVTYPKKPNEISAHIKLKNSIIGEGVSIPDPEIEVNISCNNCLKERFCENVFVQFNTKEPGDYIFKSEAELITGHIFNKNNTVFNTSWVVATPFSNFQTKEEISRHCRDDDCEPNLSMELSGSLSKEDTYIVGSSATETVIIQVFNAGNNSYEACVWVTVKGAQLSRLLENNECRESKDGYRCDLPRPLKRDQEVDIKLLLKMDSTNEFKQLDVKAVLNEKCSSNATNTDFKVKTIPYALQTTDVSVDGANREREFSALQNKDDKYLFTDVQEFLITNTGKITWKNIYAKISTNKTVNKETFKATLGTFVCNEQDSEEDFVRICYLDVMPNSTQVIATTYTLSGTDLKTHLTNKELKVEYKIELHLTPTKEIKKKSILSVLKFGTELAVGQNKLLIGIISGVIGILIILVIFIVLYKYGFFTRKEKRKLLIHRESIKQRSINRNTHISSVADKQGIEGITEAETGSDGDDDCFIDKNMIPKISTSGGIQLEAKAQVHC